MTQNFISEVPNDDEKKDSAKDNIEDLIGTDYEKFFREMQLFTKCFEKKRIKQVKK